MPGEQDPLNQHEQSSYERAETEAACSRPVGVCNSAYIHYGFQFTVFMGFLGVQMSGSLIFVRSLLFVLSNCNRLVFVLSYYILFHFILLLSLGNLF